jgi:hypothetical protein
VASAIGAAGAAGIAAHAAASAGTKVIGKAAWLTALKWGMVIAVGVPAIGFAARYALRRETHETYGAEAHVTQAREPLAAPMGSPASPRTRTAGTLPADKDDMAPRALAPLEPPRPPASSRAGRSPARTDAAGAEAPSALRAESLLLAAARAKFRGGDYHGALDDVARLGAQFPRGRLIQERELVAIDCLAALGDRQTMETRARAFLARFPASPYAAHVHDTLGQ